MKYNREHARAAYGEGQKKAFQERMARLDAIAVHVDAFAVDMDRALREGKTTFFIPLRGIKGSKDRGLQPGDFMYYIRDLGGFAAEYVQSENGLTPHVIVGIKIDFAKTFGG